jgi:hypothetical protein
VNEIGVVTWLLQDQVSSTVILANADGSQASEERDTAHLPPPFLGEGGEIRTSNGTMVTDKKFTGQLQEVEIRKHVLYLIILVFARSNLSKMYVHSIETGQCLISVQFQSCRKKS